MDLGPRNRYSSPYCVELVDGHARGFWCRVGDGKSPDSCDYSGLRVWKWVVERSGDRGRVVGGKWVLEPCGRDVNKIGRMFLWFAALLDFFVFLLLPNRLLGRFSRSLTGIYVVFFIMPTGKLVYNWYVAMRVW